MVLENGHSQTPRSPGRDELIARFMPVARRLAGKYRTPDGHEDLEQVAYLGLVKAANGYDPSRGTTFLTYAIPTITGEIKRHFRDHTWAVHVPRGLQVQALNAIAAVEELGGELGRTPTVDEVAQRLGTDRETTLDALGVAGARDARSLDAPIVDDVDMPATLADLADEGAGDEFEAAVDRDALRRALAALTPRQRLVVGLRFFGGLTQTQIAEHLGVSQMAISRLLRRTLARLRETALAAEQ
jgi:RNA polymerase sigma-B factor